MRQRSQPWIHRKSRFIIASIAALGAVITAYLTAVKLAGGVAACPVTGCDKVLESPYAVVLGLPLALFGFLAYSGMGAMAVGPWLINPESNKGLRSQAEEKTWLLMFVGAASMTIFSGYLIYLMIAVIKSFCFYCVGSAICSLALLILVLIGRNWEDIGQLIFLGVIVAMVTLIGTLAVYSPINSPRAEQGTYAITTNSAPANIALAEHLTEKGIKMYGAVWCNACRAQKQLFGKEAVAKLTYIECAPEGKNPQPQLCQAAKIQNYPTWEVDGQLYVGVRSLEELSQLSGYSGLSNFGNGG